MRSSWVKRERKERNRKERFVVGRERRVMRGKGKFGEERWKKENRKRFEKRREGGLLCRKTREGRKRKKKNRKKKEKEKKKGLGTQPSEVK